MLSSAPLPFQRWDSLLEQVTHAWHSPQPLLLLECWTVFLKQLPCCILWRTHQGYWRIESFQKFVSSTSEFSPKLFPSKVLMCLWALPRTLDSSWFSASFARSAHHARSRIPLWHIFSQRLNSVLRQFGFWMTPSIFQAFINISESQVWCYVSHFPKELLNPVICRQMFNNQRAKGWVGVLGRTRFVVFAFSMV